MKAKFPGWRTMTAAQRINAKADALMEDCRRLERERRAQGLGPPNYGLLAPDDATRAWEAAQKEILPPEPTQTAPHGLRHHPTEKESPTT